MFDMSKILQMLQGIGGNGTAGTPMPPATPPTPLNPGDQGGPLAGLGGMLNLNDGKGGPNAFGGLLNFKDEESKNAALRGMLSGSAALMAAGGPSDTPTNLLSNMGTAIGVGTGAYDAVKDGNVERAYKKAQTDRYGVANAQDLQKMEQERKAAEVRARLFGGSGFDGGSSTGATAGPSAASATISGAAAPATASAIGATATPAAAPATNDLAGQINAQRQTYQRQYEGLMIVGDGENARPIFAQMNYLDNQAAQHGLVWDGTKYTAAPGFNQGLQAMEYAKSSGSQAGTESQIRTEDQRNYSWIKGTNDSAGIETPLPQEWILDQKKAGSTQINMGDGNKYGTIPQGYRLVEENGSARLEAIPGGPDAVKAEQAQAARDKKAGGMNVASDAVDTAFNNVLRVDAQSFFPTTGFTGGILSNIGGTGANDVRAALETMKANASLSTLQKMRDESPTGAGMGSPSDSEQKMIQAAYATLEQSQSRPEFIRNLNNFRNMWMDLVHGEGNGPERHPVTYGLEPLTNEEAARAEGSTNNAGSPEVPRISGVEDFYKLAPGTTYIDPQGNTRVKR